jgi:hypothetical protein
MARLSVSREARLQCWDEYTVAQQGHRERAMRETHKDAGQKGGDSLSYQDIASAGKDRHESAAT